MSEIAEELADLIDRRARRASAVLLSFKEEHVDSYLPEGVSQSLRKAILDQVNDLAELAIDCVNKAEVESGIVNDEFFEFLERIHNNTEVMIASLEG